MDFNFGEIVEPVSRAFYDDYEDPSLNLPFTRPHWVWNTKDAKESFPATVQQLIIVEGLNALNSIQPSILKKSSPVAKLHGHKVEVFQLTQEITVCVVEEKDLNYFATIAELLEPWVKIAQSCNVLSLQSMSEYKAEETPESCIVRGLNSSFTDIPSLEVPNFISGAGAGVATLRKLLNLPFSCYIFYIDLFDILAIRTVLNVLKRLEVPVDESIPLKPLHHKSDLYM